MTVVMGEMMKRKRQKQDEKTEKQGQSTGPTGMDEATELLRKLVESKVPEKGTFAEYEATLMEIANEVVRRELERKLQTTADSHADVLRIDHNEDWHGWRDGTTFEYKRHQPGTVAYHSLVGPLTVRRYTYRERARYGVMHVPLELDAGLVERMTPALARCTALGFSQLPIRQVDKLLVAAGRRPPSRSTLERGSRDIGAYAVSANEVIEPLVRKEETIPDGAFTIGLGLDRTSVLMRKNDKGFSVDRGLRDPRPKGPIWGNRRVNGVRWRMDYVGTVSFYDEEGKRLQSRHYRLPAGGEPDVIVERMMADVTHALGQRPDLKIAIVQDGAPELWKVLRKALRAEPLVSDWVEILDWYHLDERLTACLDLCITTAVERKTQRVRWHRALLEQNDGMNRVVRSLRSYRRMMASPEQKEALSEHLRYFKKRRLQTRYVNYRRSKLPIGSGVTEGACKSLLGNRAKRGGQHWTQRGLSAAIHLRAIEQSGRFDAFWNHFSRRYRATSMAPIGSRA